MKKLIFLFVLFHIGATAWTQSAITLEECQQSARENYPLIRQRKLLQQSHNLSLENLQANYLPQFSLDAQATYQSDVTQVPIEVPGMDIPVLAKDQYKATLTINQTIYDGGTTQRQQAIENASHQVEQQQLEVELYQLRERVNYLFFSIHLLQKNLELTGLLTQELNEQLGQVQARIRNGAVLPTNADVLQAELLKVEQQQIELEAQKTANLHMLALLTRLPLDKNTTLIMPEVRVSMETSLENRPETILFDYQRQSLEANQALVGIQLRPQLSAFAQVGYGRPGLNFLDNSFTDFYVVGARLHWNLWDWGTSKNEKQKLDIRKDVLRTEEETYALNTQLSLTQKEDEIEKFNALIDKDRAIISIRSKIKATASSQLNNGVITATDFIDELYAENQAKLNLELHRMQLIKTQVEYQNLLGK